MKSTVPQATFFRKLNHKIDITDSNFFVIHSKQDICYSDTADCNSYLRYFFILSEPFTNKHCLLIIIETKQCIYLYVQKRLHKFRFKKITGD